MATHVPHKPHHPGNDQPGEPDPGLHPVEPDQGPIPPVVPTDDDGQAPAPAV